MASHSMSRCSGDVDRELVHLGIVRHCFEDYSQDMRLMGSAIESQVILQAPVAATVPSYLLVAFSKALPSLSDISGSGRRAIPFEHCR